jgi:hypothetical protein
MRIALKLETHAGHSTIFSDVFRRPENPLKRNTKSKVEKAFPRYRSAFRLATDDSGDIS